VTLTAAAVPLWMHLSRKIPRDPDDDARDVARRNMKTKAFARSRDERKRVEMRFAHLKTHHGFERMRIKSVSASVIRSFACEAVTPSSSKLTFRPNRSLIGKPITLAPFSTASASRSALIPAKEKLFGCALCGRASDWI
jgi:Transposase DDE domain